MFPKKDMLFSLLCMNKTFEKFVLWGLKKKDENKMHILYNVSGCNSGGVNPTTRIVLGILLLKGGRVYARPQGSDLNRSTLFKRKVSKIILVSQMV